MRILVWATTFGADLLSFTRYLDRRSDTQVKVVMGDPKLYRRQGVSELFPVQADLVRRRGLHDVAGVPFFRPHVTILDNRVPLRATSPKGMVLWHGFGWKGPNDRKEFRALHMQLRRAWGDPLSPNPDFRWQCFGPWDFEHRTEVSGFHPDNCRVLGAASHDDLREPIPKERLQPYYPFDVVNRKTVLLAPTWHYGEVFAHWGTDADLFRRLLGHLERRGANVILRLHDSFRFERAYRRFLTRLADEHDHVMLKFKDRDPDNFLDLQVADALVTNYSSIANLYYATRRPTIHVYPVRSEDEAFQWKQYTLLGVRERTVESARYVWKLPPEDHGGMLARSFPRLVEQLDEALDDPTCCEVAAGEFLDRHMLGADGRNCERTWEALEELVAGR
ncbi:MAG: CDP-glycerol glycerophosphotransferase family protein [Myxococcota bacterium]